MNDVKQIEPICVVDPGGYSLPYDFFFINEIQKYLKVTFIVSPQNHNDEYFSAIQSLKNTNCILYKRNTNSFIEKVKLMFHIYYYMIKHRHQFSRVHFLWDGSILTAIFAFLFFKNKNVITIHNIQSHERSLYQSLKQFFNLILFDKLLFVGEQNLSLYLQQKTPFNKKTYLIPHGTIGRPQNNLISTNKIPPNFEKSNEIVFIGRVEPYKGVMEALQIFRSPEFQDQQLLIYGKLNPSLAPFLESKAKNIKIYDKFLSNESYFTLLFKKNIFLLPYKTNSQSGIFFSIIGAGKIPVCTDKGENALILKKYNLHPLLFNLEDKQSLLKSLEYVDKNFFSILSILANVKRDYAWSSLINKKVVAHLYGISL